MVEWYMCLEWKFVYPSYISISVFRCEFSDEVLLSVMGLINFTSRQFHMLWIDVAAFVTTN